MVRSFRVRVTQHSYSSLEKATVGQYVEVHLEVIPHIQIIKKSTTDHLMFQLTWRLCGQMAL